MVIIVTASDLNDWLELGHDKPEDDRKLKMLTKRIVSDFTNYIKSKGAEITEGDATDLWSPGVAYGEYLFNRRTGAVRDVDLDVSMTFSDKISQFPETVKESLDLFIRNKASSESDDGECQLI